MWLSTEASGDASTPSRNGTITKLGRPLALPAAEEVVYYATGVK